MSASDRDRLNLYQKLDEFLGTEEANTLMEHLPPVPWNEVATKSDVAASEFALRSDIEAMGKELRTEMAAMGQELRAEMKAANSELRADMSMMRTELRAEMAVGFADIRTEMTSGFNRQIKWLITFGMAWSSLLIAVSRFAG